MKKIVEKKFLLIIHLILILLPTLYTQGEGFKSLEDRGFISGFNILLPSNCENIDYDFCKKNYLDGKYNTFYDYYIEWIKENNINLPTLNGKKVILRNPKIITYWNPNRPTLYALEDIAKLVNKTNAYVATNIYELENLFLLYNKYAFDFVEAPYFIFFEGIPYELLFNYLYTRYDRTSDKMLYYNESFRFIFPYISQTLPLFYGEVKLNPTASTTPYNINLPHYLDFGSEGEKEMYSYFKTFVTGTNSKVSSFNFFKFAWGNIINGNIGITTVNVSWINKTSKRNFTLEGIYIKYPYGFSIFYPLRIVNNNIIANIVPLGNLKNILIGSLGLYEINETQIIVERAINKFKHNLACVYYYKKNNFFNLGEDYVVLDGHLWPNGTFFTNSNAYYEENSNILKFDPNKVYYCNNGVWVDLEKDKQVCEKFAELYPVYKAYWDNIHQKCLINEINEHPIWYRNSTGNQTIVDYGLLNSSKNLRGFLDCIDKNGNIHKNGEIVGNYLCSAGVWTPLFNDPNKFYIKKYPYTIKINLTLRNFASEPVLLKSWELKGLTKGWSVKLNTKDNKKIFNSGKEIPISLIIINEEGGENINNYTLILNFVLNDSVCETPIKIEIPFKTQYSKEFLSSYYFDKPLIYDEIKKETNSVELYLTYDLLGVLKKYHLCNNIGDDNCYFITTKVTEIPKGCEVNETYKYFLEGSNPIYKIKCYKEPSKEEKIKICSAVILNKNGQKNLCSGLKNDLESVCEDHCSYINLVTETHKKNFDFNLNYYFDNLQYKLKVTIKNTGTAPIKGININLQDLTENCEIVNNHYSDPTKILNPGQTFEKVFLFNPAGLCKIKVNVTVDDPITKEKEIIINPFSENENKQIIKTDNPSLYPLYLFLVGLISLIIGVYYTKKELE